MREWIRLFEEALPRYLYHVTSSKHMPSIRKSGLMPQPCKDSMEYGECRIAIYLAKDWRTCMDHADVVIDRFGGDPVLLRVDASALDPNALEPDEYDIQAYMPGGDLADPRLKDYTRWQDVPWHLSLEVCGAVAYTKIIPPTAIKVITP